MESIKLNDWNAVSDYIDDGWYSNIKASWFEHIIQHQGMYPRDAFTKGQLASKCWLLQNLDCGMIHPNETIAILGVISNIFLKTGFSREKFFTHCCPSVHQIL